MSISGNKRRSEHVRLSIGTSAAALGQTPQPPVTRRGHGRVSAVWHDARPTRRLGDGRGCGVVLACLHPHATNRQHSSYDTSFEWSAGHRPLPPGSAVPRSRAKSEALDSRFFPPLARSEGSNLFATRRSDEESSIPPGGPPEASLPAPEGRLLTFPLSTHLAKHGATACQ